MTINPWDRPPVRDKGDTRKATTYRSVGLALSNWEYHEFVLVLIFRCIINAEWDGPVEQAFGSILTHKGRVEMLQAAAKVYFHRHNSDLKEVLRDVLDRSNKLCARRNEIAHGRVTRFVEDGKTRSGWFLLPSHFATNKHEILGVTGSNPNVSGRLDGARPKRRPLYAYTSKEIDHYAKEFWNLSQDAGGLASAIINYRMDAKMRAVGAGHPKLLQKWNELTTRKPRNSERVPQWPKPSRSR